MDTVSGKTRSRIMAAVRSRGNRSTEQRLRLMLVRRGVRGWRMQARDIAGTPDFVFDRRKLVIFVDGCFWHGCPSCYRRPSSSRAYWDAKVQRNMKRDRRVRRELRREGWSVIRIWEHELREPARVLGRITRKLKRV